MENVNMSPVPQSKEVKPLTFPQAMAAVIDGHRVTRAEWGDDDSYGQLSEGFLMICMAGKCYRWQVSDGDMLNNDWIIVSGKN